MRSSRRGDFLAMAGARLRLHDEGSMQADPRTSVGPGTAAPGVAGERRGALRFPIDQQVRYKVFARRAVEAGCGRTVNMSSTGILFTAERVLAPGERVELSVNWPAYLDQKHPLKLVAAGRVVRASNGTAAMAIDRYEFRTQGAAPFNSH